MPKKIVQLCLCLCATSMLLGTHQAIAGVSIAPYVSIKSTKSITPNAKDSTQESSKVKQRQEMGVRGSLTFCSLFSLQLGVGQSVLTTTQKTQVATDEYGQIDYKKDLNMSTADAAAEIKITETQRLAKLGLSLDPSFSIFILRAKAGVGATQRILVSEVTAQPKKTSTFGPFYKPYAGIGAGIRFTPLMYFMAEYTFDYYAFPKLEPFQREVTATYAVEL